MKIFERIKTLILKKSALRKQESHNRRRSHRVSIRMSIDEHNAFLRLQELTGMRGVALLSAWASGEPLRIRAGILMANRVRQTAGLLSRDAVERARYDSAGSAEIKWIAKEVYEAAEKIETRYATPTRRTNASTNEGAKKRDFICLRCTEEEFAAAKARANNGNISCAFRTWIASYDTSTAYVPLTDCRETLDDLGRWFLYAAEEYVPFAAAREIRAYVRSLAE